MLNFPHFVLHGPLSAMISSFRPTIAFKLQEVKGAPSPPAEHLFVGTKERRDGTGADRIPRFTTSRLENVERKQVHRVLRNKTPTVV